VIGVRVTPDLDTLASIPIKADYGVERDPDVAFDGTNYLVVWSEGIFGGEFKVKAARVTTDGVVIDSGIPFGGGAMFEYKPVVAFDGSRYLSVWYNYSQDPKGIFGRFIDTDCQPQGPVLEIRASNLDHLFDPDIAFCNDNYLIVWNEPLVVGSDDDLLAQLVSKSGVLVGDTIIIATGSKNQLTPRLTVSDNHFLVTWNQESKICGQWLDSNGKLIGGNFEISDPDIYDRSLPDIAFGNNNCLAVWMEYHTDEFDIYGNVDHGIKIKELFTSNINRQVVLPTIMRYNSPQLRSGLLLYDVSGRRVSTFSLLPGIYFVEKDGRVEQKLIIVK